MAHRGGLQTAQRPPRCQLVESLSLTVHFIICRVYYFLKMCPTFYCSVVMGSLIKYLRTLEINRKIHHVLPWYFFVKSSRNERIRFGTRNPSILGHLMYWLKTLAGREVLRFLLNLVVLELKQVFKMEFIVGKLKWKPQASHHSFRRLLYLSSPLPWVTLWY